MSTQSKADVNGLLPRRYQEEILGWAKKGWYNSFMPDKKLSLVVLSQYYRCDGHWFWQNPHKLTLNQMDDRTGTIKRQIGHLPCPTSGPCRTARKSVEQAHQLEGYEASWFIGARFEWSEWMAKTLRKQWCSYYDWYLYFNLFMLSISQTITTR